MSLIISNNLNSLMVQTNLSANQSQLSTAMQRLSSGLRINSAADDAAGLAIATNLNAQANGDGQAIQNANSASSLAQIADGALANITNDLQTLNTLAVESANGTNSASNRAALQTQASALIADIQHIASTTNYNGVNLLDGSFKSAFQIGATAGQTVGLSIANSQAAVLGSGQGNGIAAQGTGVALAAGDLVINGVAIGASLATSDTASTTNASFSAIAKVAAINAVSSQTGVSASVDATVAQGAAMTAGGGASVTGTLTINNVAITLTTVANNTAATRQAEVSAINAVSGQTGVTASDTGSDKTGVTLTAADGRNIAIVAGATSLSAVLTGIGLNSTSTTQVNTYGGYTLSSSNGQPISVQSGTGTLSDSGLQAGTYQPNTAGVASTALTAVTSAGTAAATAAGLASGDLVINGVAIGATTATSDSLSYSNNASSSIAIAAAINAASSTTGVTATVNANTITGTSAGAAAGHTGTLMINGVNTALITTGATASATASNIIAAVNAISGQTGVAATLNAAGDGVNLSAADGRNISLSLSTASQTLVAADVGLGITSAIGATTTTYGTYTLSSGSPIKIGSNTLNGQANAGLAEGSYGGTASGESLSNLDISTVSGANAAITAVGNALNTVNAIRANIGAFENRMSATVTNLQSTQTNLTSASTGITGADFAAETAALSRAQVIQQAGIAVLSQANAQSQQVLALLR